MRERRRRLSLHVIFPDCWNGKSLDSADHKSHVAYSHKGDDDVYRCPSSHKVAIPRLTMRFEWDFYPNPSTLSLASGSIHSMHADFWNTWHQPRLDQLVKRAWTPAEVLEGRRGEPAVPRLSDPISRTTAARRSGARRS